MTFEVFDLVFQFGNVTLVCPGSIRVLLGRQELRPELLELKTNSGKLFIGSLLNKSK